MTKKLSYLCSTIGRKQVVGLTGLGLSLFVLAHMAGNLLIFVSAQKYNEYSHALISNPLIYLAEGILLLIFVSHLVLAIGLQIRNRKARPEGYAVSATGDKGTSLVAKTMAVQGLVILVFLVLHILTFKFGTYYGVNYGSGEIRDMHRLVVEVFQQPVFVWGYCAALVVLGLHLSHGLKSSFQTLGMNHPKYDCAIRSLSYGYALIVAAGFISQPLYVFFLHRG